MKVSLKALRDDLTERLILKFRPLGFELAKNGFFHKMTESGGWSVGAGWIRHTSDFDATLNVSLRIAALEDLILEAEPERGDNRYSMGAEIGNISEGRQRRWSVTAYADLDPVSESITEALERVGIPYLERYSVMENALAAISGDDAAAWLHSPVHGERAKRALALAFLLKRYDVFKELAVTKTAFLSSRHDQKLEEFVLFRMKLEDRISGI